MLKGKIKRLSLSLLLLSITILPTISYAQGNEANPITSSDPFANSIIASKNAITGEITTKSIPSVAQSKKSKTGDIAAANIVYAPETSNDVGMVTPNAVIGDDNRTEMSTYIYGIVQLELTWPNGGTGTCTGFMISQDALATAGHCVYNSSKGGWVSNVKVNASRKGSTYPFGTYNGTYFHTSQNYINGDSDFDYGVIEVSSDLGKKTGYFGFTWQSSSYNGSTVTVTGYPGEKIPGQWTMSGTVYATSTYLLSYNVDTTGGQSGAPVYKNGNIAVAIHIEAGSAANNGRRITESLYNWLMTFR